MEIRKLDVSDEAAYRAYQTALENDDNPFITTREIGDFKTFVENSRAQETQTTNPDYSTMTTYYAFLNGKIAALISCRWQLEKGNLATIGGHIGYQTSPEFRRQGIMTRLLSFALEHMPNVASILCLSQRVRTILPVVEPLKKLAVFWKILSI